MSIAREQLQTELEALAEAVAMQGVSSGIASTSHSFSGESVLRRGATITALIMLETFVRNRTEEILQGFEQWPSTFENLPDRFRARATLDALSNIEKFARMLKRQSDDYESEIFSEVTKISKSPSQQKQFSRFFAGDYTGNISDNELENLLKSFQIKKCWDSFRILASEVGFGVPSVKAILNSVVRNRHRSAHVSGFDPSSSDVSSLPENIRILAICFDVSMSASQVAAMRDWQKWTNDDFNWSQHYELFFIKRHTRNKYKLIKKDATRATRIMEHPFLENDNLLPLPSSDKVRLVITSSDDGRPAMWSIH